jgi:hypothetical protein
VNPNVRGIWLNDASGQMLRHSPGSVRNSAGASGTYTPQKTRNPTCGQRKQLTTNATVTATIAHRTARQATGGTARR